MRAWTRGSRDADAPPAHALTRRSLLTRSAALGAGAAAAAVTPARASHTPPGPTPDRPPPSSQLFSAEEVTLAFRCHGMHLEALQFPITPLGQHFVLLHFDVPYFAPTDSYAFTIGGRVRTPMTVTLGQLKARLTGGPPPAIEEGGGGGAPPPPPP